MLSSRLSPTHYYGRIQQDAKQIVCFRKLDGTFYTCASLIKLSAVWALKLTLRSRA